MLYSFIPGSASWVKGMGRSGSPTPLRPPETPNLGRNPRALEKTEGFR